MGEPEEDQATAEVPRLAPREPLVPLPPEKEARPWLVIALGLVAGALFVWVVMSLRG